MLIILLFLIGLIPLLYYKNVWNYLQIIIFFITGLSILKLNINSYFRSLRIRIGFDTLSYSLILLTLWICVLIISSRYSIYKRNYKITYFMLVIIILIILLVLTFRSLNIFLFYLFFESSLIPTLLLILGWGYQPERLQAGIYLLFYTLTASLPLLLVIFYIQIKYNSLHLLMLEDYLEVESYW